MNNNNNVRKRIKRKKRASCMYFKRQLSEGSICDMRKDLQNKVINKITSKRKIETVEDMRKESIDIGEIDMIPVSYEINNIEKDIENNIESNIDNIESNIEDNIEDNIESNIDDNIDDNIKDEIKEDYVLI